MTSRRLDASGRVKSPAPFTATILDEIEAALAGALPSSARVLDPFAGTGRVHRLPYDTIGVEIEREWAEWHPRTIRGDATCLPFPDSTFRAIVTSPTYGSRMADHHTAAERCRECKGVGVVVAGPGPDTGVLAPRSVPCPVPCPKCHGKGRRDHVRHTYRHYLARPLTPGSTAGLQWGAKYRELHVAAWREAYRVLAPYGYFVLNIKDHVRKGVVVPVSDWHLTTLQDLGLVLVEKVAVETPGMKHGANRDARVGHETVAVLRKPPGI
jgi:tRNA G10  N-methylase Trm11